MCAALAEPFSSLLILLGLVCFVAIGGVSVDSTAASLALVVSSFFYSVWRPFDRRMLACFCAKNSATLEPQSQSQNVNQSGGRLKTMPEWRESRLDYVRVREFTSATLLGSAGCTGLADIFASGAGISSIFSASGASSASVAAVAATNGQLSKRKRCVELAVEVGNGRSDRHRSSGAQKMRTPIDGHSQRLAQSKTTTGIGSGPPRRGVRRELGRKVTQEKERERERGAHTSQVMQLMEVPQLARLDSNKRPPHD